MNGTHANIQVGSKLVAPANYRGEAIPAIEWQVVKENRKSFVVQGTLNAGKPNWRWFSLYMNKTTGQIHA